MGYYSTFEFSAKLKKNTPEPIIQFLNVMAEKRYNFLIPEDFPEGVGHEKFFQCENWHALFYGKNQEDFPDPTFTKEGEYYKLTIKSQFKDYDQEIDNFIDWISPFIAGRKKRKYVGYHQGEDSKSPINIYINTQH